MINFTINGITLLVRCEHALRSKQENAKEMVDKALSQACGLGEGEVSATKSKGANGQPNGFETLLKAADTLPVVECDSP